MYYLGVPNMAQKGMKMVNTQLLKKKIKSSGLKMKYLAKKLGISQYGLSLKIDGVNEFKASEIKIISQELKIGPEEKEIIFFT
ncbi:hypothetical protein C815_00951 [Firmicutes bacterium M10-2]|nr:hypothetical protein C815_00951 [Firmicutes bacterium M10-2]